MRDNLLAVSALKISARFRLFCVQIDHQLHELNHIFNHKIQHVMFCEFTYTKCLLNYLTKRNLTHPGIIFCCEFEIDSAEITLKAQVLNQRHIIRPY